MKKNFKRLPEVTAEIIALRKAQGLPPLEENPKTLSAAKDMLAGMRKFNPSTKQAVAAVTKLAGASLGDLASLSDIQSQLDAATGSNRVKLLDKHAADYLAAAQSARADKRVH